MTDKSPKFVEEIANVPLESLSERMGKIEALRENSLEEVRAKKKAFNDIIPAFTRAFMNLGAPSTEAPGDRSRDPVDAAVEAESDDQDAGLISFRRERAEAELVRLGDKEEALLNQEKAA